MELSGLSNGCGSWDCEFGIGRPFAWNSLARRLGSVVLAVSLRGVTVAQSAPLVLERDGRVISLEPYAANVLRVTMSTDKAEATGAPGYGFVATPSAEGWTHERDAEGGEVFRSSRMVVRVTPGNLPAEKLPQPMPLDALNRQLREPYFGGGGGQGPYNDALLVTTADGKMLLHMRTWTMAPESAEVAAAGRRREGLPGFGYIRLAGRRALLRTGPAAKGLDGPAGSPDPLLA